MWRLLLACTSVLSISSFVDAQQITLIQPNGGESIDGCAPYDIEWTASGTSYEFNIDYSTDGGQTWVSLASFLTNANSCSWEAPNIYSTGCLVRVYDAQAPEVTDASNSRFALNAPIQFLYPDGGETLFAGQTVQVGWMSAYYLSTVGLQLSLDNGLTWTTVATNLDGGLFEWTVHNSPSSTARLRVGTDFSSCFVDGSASAFTIVSSVTVNAPNGGEGLTASVVPPS